MGNGWICLHRSLLDWEWWQDANTSRLYIYLLLSANHEPGKWQGVEIERGQLVTGLNSLSLATGLSVRSVRTCLERLISTGELTRKTTSKFSIITICNYNKFQDKKIDNDKQNDSQADKQTTSKRQANDKQTTTNNNITTKQPNNENKKTKNKSAPLSLDDFEIPTNLDNEKGRELIQWWVDYKKEQFGFTYKTIGFKSFLSSVSNYSIPDLERDLTLSIGKGYKGIVSGASNFTPSRQSPFGATIDIPTRENPAEAKSRRSMELVRKYEQLEKEGAK